jgi:hypothetical protein
VSESLGRRALLAGGLRLGVGAASAAVLPRLVACSSDPPEVCGLGCAGDADAFAARLGAPLQYERIYHQVEPFPGPSEVAAWAAGRIPVSSFKTLDAVGAPIPFAQVAEGLADAQLDAVARSLDEGVKDKLVLIYFHEPEEEAGQRPADFAAAFAHVRSRIEQTLGSTTRRRIRWAVCLTHAYYTNGSSTEYLPGNDVVDVLAVDGYNWCPGSGHGERRIDFRSLFEHAEAFARARGKPWLITEVGTWDDPEPGWSKADWIEDAASVIEGWPSLEAVMWFEHSAGFACDWSLGSDEDALEAFKDLGERMCAKP